MEKVPVTEEAIKRKQIIVIDCAVDYFKWAQEDIFSKIKMSWYQGVTFAMRKAKWIDGNSTECQTS